MNGSENTFAGALFFSLIAICAVLKIDDLPGIAIAAGSAICAASFLRRALTQAALSAEEDHQRIEIQFQQLRQKINEGYGTTADAMNAITDTSTALMDSLQGIQARLAFLEDFKSLTETVSAVGASMKSIEDSSAATEINLRRLGEKFAEVSDATEKNSAAVGELAKNLTSALEKIQASSDETKNSAQTATKLLGVVGQLLKNPAFVKNFETMQSSLEEVSNKLQVLEDLKNSFAEIVTFAEKISGATEKSETATTNSAESFREVGDKIAVGTENLTAMFDDVKTELSTLTKKLDAYNGLTRATLEQYSNLTEQDVRILEKISERLNARQ